MWELSSLFPRNKRRRKFGGKSIEPKLSIEISARTRPYLIKPAQGAHHPARVNSFCDALEFLAERRITKLRRFDTRTKFEKVREQTIKNGKLFFERDFPVFRNCVRLRKDLPKFLAACRTLQDL